MKRSRYLYVLPLLALAGAAGVWYERRAERALLRRHPAPGRLVDVGGRRMHLVSLGEKRPGQPTVILEAGHSDWSICWRAVQPEIARFARVCAYDRAGFGWSDPGPLPRSPRQIVTELHSLLERAGEQPPYLFVGHSLGGAFSRLYASLYPEEVTGMVWVDSAHENMQRFLPFWPAAFGGIMAAGRSAALLASLGLIRLLNHRGAFAVLPGVVTPVDQGPAIPYSVSPRFYNTVCEETRAWYHQPNWRDCQADFGDLPVVMLEAQYPADPPPGLPRRQWRQYLTGWRAIQDDLSRRSTRTRRVPVACAHQIQLEQPDVVVAAIQALLGSNPRRCWAATKALLGSNPSIAERR